MYPVHISTPTILHSSGQRYGQDSSLILPAGETCSKNSSWAFLAFPPRKAKLAACLIAEGPATRACVHPKMCFYEPCSHAYTVHACTPRFTSGPGILCGIDLACCIGESGRFQRHAEVRQPSRARKMTTLRPSIRSWLTRKFPKEWGVRLWGPYMKDPIIILG